MASDGNRTIDMLFPYPTPKVARIKDCRLGLLRYALMTSVALYIVVFQIMMKGSHLQSMPLTGVHQVEFGTPTMNNCNAMDADCMQNFTSMQLLPYCSQNSLVSSLKLPCEYWDVPSLAQITAHGLMLPTHIAEYLQTPECKPAAMNNWTCIGWLYNFVDKSGQPQYKRGSAAPAKDIFIADIERFTMRMDHSVRSEFGHRFYSSSMVGHLLDCSEEDSDSKCERRPIVCDHKDCPAGTRKIVSGEESSTLEQKSQKVLDNEDSDDADDFAALQLLDNVEIDPGGEVAARQLPENEESDDDDDDFAALQLHHGIVKSPTSADEEGGQLVHFGESLDLMEQPVSLAQGDIFSIGLLLRSANISLDKSRNPLPAWAVGSYRSSGLVLVIRISYTNKETWMGLKVLPWHILGPTPRYTIRITKHSSYEEFLLRKVHAAGEKEPKGSRILTEYHGIRILIEQSGELVAWNNLQLLLILTTSLAFLAVSNCITDTVALYCLDKSDEYAAIKFERPRRRKKQNDDSGHESDQHHQSQQEDDRIQRYSSMTM